MGITDNGANLATELNYFLKKREKILIEAVSKKCQSGHNFVDTLQNPKLANS